MSESVNSVENFILNYTIPVDYKKMLEYLNIFSKKYDFLEIAYLGSSVLGRSIPIVKLGNGEHKILYVAAHHSMEWITTVLMLKFINEYSEFYKLGRRMYNINMEYMFRNRTIYVLPMLNPDGIELVHYGVNEDNPMKERLIKMNKGSNDFSHWQANARGVDLNHNYNAGFKEYKKLELENSIYGGAPTRYSGEYPESEPETGSLCDFIRFNNIKLILSFHSQGEEIYWNYNGNSAPRSLSCGKLLSRMSGYTLSEAKGFSSYGGLKDWYISEFNRPAFTIECGKGENPLPLDNYFSIYLKLRELLFTSPILC